MDVSTLPDVAGKVAVVRRTQVPDDEENALTQVLFDAGATCVLVLTDGATVEALDDTEMYALGWVRAPKAPKPPELAPRASHVGHRIDTFYRGDGFSSAQCVDCNVPVEPVGCG